MNVCFLYGKIVGKIDFQFVLNSPNIAVSIFKVILSNGTAVTIKAYDQLADYCYSKLKEEDFLAIEGYLNNMGEVVAVQVKKI